MKIAIYTLHIFESLRNHWVLMPHPRFVHLSACDIFLDKCVAKKMVTRIYYLMDYDKLRPRLRSSWVHFKLCRCICSDAPLRNQVLSISSQIAPRRWSKMRSRFCLRMAISSGVGLLFRFFEMVVAFALAKARHILICSSNITLLFVISTDGLFSGSFLSFTSLLRELHFLELCCLNNRRGRIFLRCRWAKEFMVPGFIELTPRRNCGLIMR